MGNLLVCPNNKKLLLTSRTASTSFCEAAICSFWPDVFINNNFHPAVFLPTQEYYDGTQDNVALIVRNPYNRFISSIKHNNLDINYALNRPKYCPTLPTGNFVYFKFETELQSCADWLKITCQLNHLNESVDTTISLNSEQLNRFNQIYANDILLWENL